MVDAAVEHDPSRSAPSGAAAAGHSWGGALMLLLTRLVRVLPFMARSWLGYLLGFIGGLFPSREARIAKLQLRAFFGPTPPFLVARVFANAGRTMLESLQLAPFLAKANRRVSAPNWDEVQRWIADDRPLIALTGHTGNWDLLAAYTIHRGIPLTTVGREAQNPTAQQILRSMRENYGIETIWRSDRGGVKRLLECMRDRRTVAALIDQDTRVDSVFVPFFGHPVKTPSALIVLGQKAQARFVSAFMFRTGPFRFETFIQELPSSGSVEDILAAYNRNLEDLLRRFPSQWVWFHKRWRSRPDGETMGSRRYLQWLKGLPPRGA